MLNGSNQHLMDMANVSLEDLKSTLNSSISPDDLVFTDRVEQQVPLYDAQALTKLFESSSDDQLLHQAQAEWQWVWESGPGILVFKQAFSDTSDIDHVTSAFKTIIKQEQLSGGSAADHFAKAGANDRIWNALEKLAITAPNAFVHYYKNNLLAAAATAWLGPGYQITAQVNNVRPGGVAQVAHRDYHLGFMTPNEAVRYPAHVHALSPMLTLQCAIAHVDMPLESGPTLYLPHSQKYSHGYLLADYAPFHQYFAKHRVQLALEKGDLVMFNPALLHAAGSNVSEGIHRMANLLQISSAFGRAMESVDRTAISLSIYEALMDGKSRGELSDKDLECVIAASAEGYPFPTNLDRDPPVNGLAPISQQALIREAISDNWSHSTLAASLEHYADKRRT